MRILLVDDEPFILNALSRVLGVMHDVTTASNGQDALKVLEEDDDFDVVLTDLSMPRLGGWGLYTHICQQYPHLTDKVIFCSAGARSSQIRQIEATGNIFLEKPVDPAQLLNSIQYLVDAA